MDLLAPRYRMRTSHTASPLTPSAGVTEHAGNASPRIRASAAARSLCGSMIASERTPAIVSLHAVHAIVESCRDPELLAKVNRFDAVLPDGQPVRWALNQLHRTGLRDRVYGPELMLRLCARAADEGIPIYLYGSGPHVIMARADIIFS